MKIQMTPLVSAVPFRADAAQVASLQVFGPMDPSHSVVRRARELVEKTGSAAMLKSFDWAVANDALITEK